MTARRPPRTPRGSPSAGRLLARKQLVGACAERRLPGGEREEIDESFRQHAELAQLGHRRPPAPLAPGRGLALLERGQRPVPGGRVAARGFRVPVEPEPAELFPPGRVWAGGGREARLPAARPEPQGEGDG